MKLAQRLARIEPFYVMEFAKQADALAHSAACDPARGGREMIYLNIGQPDFTAPPAVVAAAERALREGRAQYTDATGLPALRERIAAWYGQRFGLDIPARRIVVTAGASAALQLLCLALFEPGDEVLMPDPCYPCNRHFVAAAGGLARLIPSGADARFQLDAAAVERHWQPATRAVLLASPSNPTGTSIASDELRRIVEAVRARGGVTVVDEIYLGLSYDTAFGQSALGLAPHADAPDVISVNSFSKYFSMTGWRLGWLVLPEALVEPVERLAQHLYICPSTLAQHAALACFEPESLAEFERRREAFRARRDFIVPALRSLCLDVPVMPDGAFYAWADCSRVGSRVADNSWDFCVDMMRLAQVTLTPGRDFGPAFGERFFRLSFANSLDHLQAAVDRMAGVLAR